MRMRPPTVSVRACGRDGYEVVFHPSLGGETVLKKFTFANGPTPAIEKRVFKAHVRALADSYRTGVEKGLQCAALTMTDVLT